MTEDRYKLPEEWKWLTIGEIFSEIKNGTTEKQNDDGVGVPVSRIETIQNAIFDLRRIKHIKKPTKELLSSFRYRYGDIALSHINSKEHVGKTAIYLGYPDPFIHGMNLLRLRLENDLINPKYVYHYFQTIDFRNDVRLRVKHAVNQVSINQKNISIIPVPISPLNIQNKIVIKIEKLLGQRNEAKESISKVMPLLKKFRQSVLAKAFSGDLTEEWRAKQRNLEPASKLLERIREERKKLLGKKYKESGPLDTSDLPELPEGWKWVTFEECCLLNPRHSSDIPLDKQVSFVPMSAIDAELGMIAKPETKALKEVIKGFTHFADGDVLFAKITPCMENGKAAVANNLMNSIGCGTTELHVLRPLGGILPEYIYHYIRQQSFRDRAEANMTGTAGQLRVPIDFIKHGVFPLPPLKEQEEIVKKIQSFFGQANSLEKSVKIAQVHCEKLNQSILAKAFRGELG